MKSNFKFLISVTLCRRLPAIAVLLATAGAFVPLCLSDGLFVSSDTHVVTNSATAAIPVTNYPQLSGNDCAWHPSGILANFRDSPTGAVLRVDHVRSGVINRHVNTTNTISVTNTLFTTNAVGAVSAIIWYPAGVYTIVPPNDSLRITTSSTNAEIILNKNVE